MRRNRSTQCRPSSRKSKAAPSLSDQANIPTYEKESREPRDNAREQFRLALELHDRTTPLEEVNNARYYLCYLAYQAGDYFDAAVLGEFLAKRPPDEHRCPTRVEDRALSYMQLYNTAVADDRAGEKRRMESLADFITRRFAGEAEADEAWMTLMIVATNEHDVDQILTYLAKIPEQSPRRAEAELKAGQGIWVASLAAGASPRNRVRRKRRSTRCVPRRRRRWPAAWSALSRRWTGSA